MVSSRRRPPEVARESLDPGSESLDIGALPLNVENVSLDIERLPLNVENVPLDIERLSLNVENVPLDIEMVPLNVENVPLDIERVPLNVENVPLDFENVSLDVEILSSNIENVPGDLEGLPRQIGEVPGNLERPRSHVDGLSCDPGRLPCEIESLPPNLSRTAPNLEALSGEIGEEPSGSGGARSRLPRELGYPWARMLESELAERTGGRKPSEQAVRMARSMPLVHYPARQPLREWAEWPELASKKVRNLAEPADPFERLEWQHVYAYAGPCCYLDPDHPLGDAAAYFRPDVEEGQRGQATPFDSGSLVGAKPRLQPWAAHSVDDRWVVLGRYSIPIEGWRHQFERWLQCSYDDPDRYLDTRGDRQRDGFPDRTTPAEIHAHNGPNAGGGESADRRGWTWELRVEDRLPFERIAVLHIPFSQLEAAEDLRAKHKWADRPGLTFETLPRHEAAGPDALYRHSGPLIRGLVS